MSVKGSQSLCVGGNRRQESDARHLLVCRTLLTRALSITVVMLVALISGAQVPGVPEKCLTAKLSGSSDDLDKIVGDYFAGNEDDVKKNVRKLLGVIANSDWNGPVGKELCETAPNFEVESVSIVIYTPSRSETGEIIRFFLDDPYGEHLHGVKSVWEVFLASSVDTELETSYVSTRKQNPIIEKIPGFVKLFDLGTMKMLQKPVKQDPDPGKGVFAVISKLDFKIKRGTVEISDKASFLPRISKEKAKEIRTSSKKLLDKLSDRQGQISPCAVQVATDMATRTSEKLSQITRASPKSGAEVSKQWKDLSDAASSGADDAFKSSTCRLNTPQPSPTQVAGLDAALQVEEQFLDLISAPKTTKATGSFSYENVPLSRFGLAVMAGIITNADDSDRVKLDSGKLAADPLNGTMAALAVNIHPFKFDPVPTKMSLAERLRIFIGASFSPEPGVIGGVGIGLVRGLSVNVGYGNMWVDVVKEGDEIGQEPTDPEKPFETGRRNFWFAGFGYNF